MPLLAIHTGLQPRVAEVWKRPILALWAALGHHFPGTGRRFEGSGVTSVKRVSGSKRQPAGTGPGRQHQQPALTEEELCMLACQESASKERSLASELVSAWLPAVLHMSLSLSS